MKRVPLFLSCALALAAAAVFAGEPPVPQKTSLQSEHSEFWTVGNETRCICTGTPTQPVTLTGTNLKIVCDRLEIIAQGVGDTTSTAPVLEKFKYLLATGRVRIEQGDRVATCGRAEVFPRENKLELTEKPSVVDRGSGWSQSGTKITMFRGERRVIVENSELLGPPIKDLGFDARQPAPGAPTPKAAPKQ